MSVMSGAPCPVRGAENSVVTTLGGDSRMQNITFSGLDSV